VDARAIDRNPLSISQVCLLAFQMQAFFVGFARSAQVAGVRL
jgi:hypothetical protein